MNLSNLFGGDYFRFPESEYALVIRLWLMYEFPRKVIHREVLC